MLQFDLTKIKNYLRLGLDFTDHDELLEDLFDYVCADAQKYIGFDLSATDYVDEIHVLKYWERTFSTKGFPILDPTDPYADVFVVTVNNEEVDIDDLSYDYQGNLTFLSSINLCQGLEENTVKVTYRAGFDIFPKDVEMAIYKQVKAEYEESGNNISSISDLSTSENKRELIGGLPPDVYRIYNSHRRNVV